MAGNGSRDRGMKEQRRAEKAGVERAGGGRVGGDLMGRGQAMAAGVVVGKANVNKKLQEALQRVGVE